MNRRSLLRSLAPVALLAPSTPHAQHAVAPWPPGQALPVVEAVDLQGRPWRLADLSGRPVLLNFWASWCEPCRAEMPTLQALAELYGPEQLAVVALNFKEAPATVARFVQRTGVRLRVVLDRDGAIARACAVKVFPTTLLIGADGRPRQRLRGELDWTGAEAERLVQELLAAPGR